MISISGQVWRKTDSSVSPIYRSALKQGISTETKGGIILIAFCSLNLCHLIHFPSQVKLTILI